MEFAKICYIKFSNGKLTKMEYTDSVERDNEVIIKYIFGAYPKGEITNVFIVEK